jgi:hypothetical protein
MATIQPTLVTGEESFLIATWEDLTSADTGAAVNVAAYPDRSVQLCAGDGATLEGSMDGLVWASLTDQNGDPLSLTSSAIKFVLENAVYVRVASPTSAGVKVILLAVR